MTGGGPLPDADELLAAELALGLIDGEERRAALWRLASDPDFAAAYDQWALLALAGAPRIEALRPSLWLAIEQKLPANDRGSLVRSRQVPWWWQAAAIAATAVAAVLTVAQVREKPVPAKPAFAQNAGHELVAVLSTTEGSAVVTVSFDVSTGQLMWAPARLEVGDKVAELWVIPADKRPRSLGLINAKGPGSKHAPSSAAGALATDATVAVSLEPIGGSPTGAPTGPVIVSGKFSLI